MTLEQKKWFCLGKFFDGVIGYPVVDDKDTLLKQPKYYTTVPAPPFDKPYETLSPINNLGISFSYTIE